MGWRWCGSQVVGCKAGHGGGFFVVVVCITARGSCAQAALVLRRFASKSANFKFSVSCRVHVPKCDEGDKVSSHATRSSSLVQKEFQLHKLDASPALETSATGEELMKYFKDMAVIRRMETIAADAYRAKQIRGFLHLYSGQVRPGPSLPCPWCEVCCFVEAGSLAECVSERCLFVLVFFFIQVDNLFAHSLGRRRLWPWACVLPLTRTTPSSPPTAATAGPM
jgi:hypothetical protein